MPRFGAFFVSKGTAFRCFILEPVPDVPLVRLWGSIGTRIPIWVACIYEKYLQIMYIFYFVFIDKKAEYISVRY